MKRLNGYHILFVALSVMFYLASFAQAQVGVDPRIDTQIMVRVQPGQSLEAFLAQFQQNHPEVTLTPNDSIEGRATHLLDLELPPGATAAFVDALANDLDTNYVTWLVWGEFLYENQAPEGKTGSTWVEQVTAGCWMSSGRIPHSPPATNSRIPLARTPLA